MRSEKEMMDLILNTALVDDRILAAFISGSRMDLNAPKDMFQDFDIVYIVKETASFIEDRSMLSAFGNLLLLQEPERLDKLRGLEADVNLSYGYLMLFDDGNRIDLHIVTEDGLRQGYMVESLMKPLIDKTGLLSGFTEKPSDKDYIIKKPGAPDYEACCNDFYWCLQNVAKGLWRDEIPYVKEMFEYIINSTMKPMINWWIGIKNNFCVSTGKMGKYYKKYLPQAYYNLFLDVYSDSDKEHIWNAVFTSIDLFSSLAKSVGKSLGYTYIEEEEKNMTAYLKNVRNLPKDAESVL